MTAAHFRLADLVPGAYRLYTVRQWSGQAFTHRLVLTVVLTRQGKRLQWR